jgi:hypothetical protein
MVLPRQFFGTTYTIFPLKIELLAHCLVYLGNLK